MIKKIIPLITIILLTSSCIAIKAKMDDFEYAPKYGKDGFPENNPGTVY